MSTQHFELLVSYKEIGRPVEDEELVNAFDSLVDSLIVYDDDLIEDMLDYAEEVDRQRELAEESILETVSPQIRNILIK